MMKIKNNITYIDEENLLVQFPSVIVNINSLNGKQLLLSQFVKKHDLVGITNGKIFIFTEIKNQSIEIFSLINDILKPLGLKNEKDYIVIENKKIDSTNNLKILKVDWLIINISNTVINVYHKKNTLQNHLELNNNDKTLEEYQLLLIKYFQKINPYKLQLNPTIIDITNGRVRFGMAKHMGVLSFSLDHLLEYTT